MINYPPGLSESELHSRYEIYLEKYYKTINIEALTMIDMLKKDIMPAVSAFEKGLKESAVLDEELSLLDKDSYDYKTILKIRKHMKDLFRNIEKIEKLLSEKPEGALKEAFYYRNKIIPVMDLLRKDADELERITDREYWPMPTYVELLFGVR